MAEVSKMGLREIRASDTVGAYRFGDYFGLRLAAATVALVVSLGSGVLQAGGASSSGWWRSTRSLAASSSCLT